MRIAGPGPLDLQTDLLEAKLAAITAAAGGEAAAGEPTAVDAGSLATAAAEGAAIAVTTGMAVD